MPTMSEVPDQGSLSRRLMRAVGRLPFIGALARWGWSLLNLRSVRVTAAAGLQQAVDARREIDQLRDRVAADARREMDQLRDRMVRLSAGADAELDRRATMLATEMSILARRLTTLEVEFYRLRAERLVESQRTTRADASPDKSVAGGRAPVSQVSGHPDFDRFYLDFEDKFRGSRAEVKRRVTVHADRFLAAGAGTAAAPIVDLGCGRGEWLEVVRERDLTAYGVDGNAVAVELCRSAGLTALHGDALEHLRGLPDGSLGGITAFHVAEHLEPSALMELLDQALRTLIPHGILLLETPNPENILVGARNFWFDPTHRNPIPPPVLEFLVQHRGFVDTEIVRLHPYPEDERLPRETELGRRLDGLISGPQDYAVIGRRPG